MLSKSLFEQLNSVPLLFYFSNKMSAHNLIEEEEEELAIGTVIFTAGDAKVKG